MNLDGMVSDERGNGYDENGNWEDEWREQLNAVEIEDRVEKSPIVMENSDPHQFPVTEVCDDCHSLDHGDVVSREYTNSVEYQECPLCQIRDTPLSVVRTIYRIPKWMK